MCLHCVASCNFSAPQTICAKSKWNIPHKCTLNNIYNLIACRAAFFYFFMINYYLSLQTTNQYVNNMVKQAHSMHFKHCLPTYSYPNRNESQIRLSSFSQTQQTRTRTHTCHSRCELKHKQLQLPGTGPLCPLSSVASRNWRTSEGKIAWARRGVTECHVVK